jgi:hypothetical protein
MSRAALRRLRQIVRFEEIVHPQKPALKLAMVFAGMAR